MKEPCLGSNRLKSDFKMKVKCKSLLNRRRPLKTKGTFKKKHLRVAVSRKLSCSTRKIGRTLRTSKHVWPTRGAKSLRKRWTSIMTP